jgi:hypothetical protein
MIMHATASRSAESLAGRLRVWWVIGILCAGAAAALSGCAKPNAPVIAGREPLKKVFKVETNVGMLEAWTTNRAKAETLVLIDPSDEMAVFPPDIMQDITNAAGHLKQGHTQVIGIVGPWVEAGGTVNLGYMAGMFKRVIWVVPSKEAVGKTPIDNYVSYLQSRRGFPPAALKDFKAAGDYITGSITGVPVTITRLADLSLEKGSSAIIAINLSYFTSLKTTDPSYMTGTKSLVAFLRALRDKNIPTPIVTVNLASKSGLVGLDIRFFGDVIREALIDPRTIGDVLPEKSQTMIQAEDSLAARKYDSAADIYSKLAEGYSNDPGLRFSLAFAEGLAGKGKDALSAVLAAYGADKEYRPGFFQLAKVLGANGRVDAGLAILNSSELAVIFPKDAIDYEKGLFYYAAGRPKEAIGYLLPAAAQRSTDFNLLLIIIQTQKALGDVNGELAALKSLIALNEEKVKWEDPWAFAELGRIEEKKDSLETASLMYEKYIGAVPQDSLGASFQKKIDAWKAKGRIKPETETRKLGIKP